MASRKAEETEYDSEEEEFTVGKFNIVIPKVVLGKYARIKVLGSGAYALVFSAKNIHNPLEFVAIKRTIDFDPFTCGIPRDVIREVSFLKKMARKDQANKPVHVVKLLEAKVEGKGDRKPQIYCVMEMMEGTLGDFVNDPTLWNSVVKFPGLVQSVFKQILIGAQSLHSHGIIHRDLKPWNILYSFTPEGEILVKIGDLGLGRSFNKASFYTQYQVATPSYRAPEITFGSNNYSFPVDMWSIGIIIIEFCRKINYFSAVDNRTLLKQYATKFGVPTEDTWPGISKLPSYDPSIFPKKTFDEAQLFAEVNKNGNLGELGFDLIKKLFTWDPDKRISATGALAHPYFQVNLKCPVFKRMK